MRLISVLLLSVAPALGWGCDAHQFIALTARGHLTPAASRAVDELLRAYPMEPKYLDSAQKRFCREHQTDIMADSANWADDVRLKLDDPWHFIDIPLSLVKPVTDLTPWCSPINPSVRGGQASGCVTNALEFNSKILENRSLPGAQRADALRFIIHLFGDITQPLHNVSDTGGNCITVYLYDQERSTYLHAAWDSGILTNIRTQRKISMAQLFAELDRQFQHQGSAWMKEKFDPVKWTWESHLLAVRVAYGTLSPRVPDEITGKEWVCDEEKAESAKLKIRIDDTYVNQAWPVMQEQMMKAAYRLGGYLNRSLGH
jgi:hypothetical protein